MRFLPTSLLGIVDYLLGVFLIAAPWLFAFADGSLAQWTAIVVGGVLLASSISTRYELGVIPLIDVRSHLVVDAVAGIVLAISPWLFLFAHRLWVPHLVLGLVVVAVSLISELHPRSLQTPTGHSAGV